MAETLLSLKNNPSVLITGTDHNDTLYGSSGHTIFYGDLGNDTYYSKNAGIPLSSVKTKVVIQSIDLPVETKETPCRKTRHSPPRATGCCLSAAAPTNSR
ncbi:hypothetical protein [Neisseria sicca]